MTAVGTLSGLLSLVWIASWFAAIWAGLLLSITVGLALFLQGLLALVFSLLCAGADERLKREAKAAKDRLIGDGRG
jgi:membrane protein implicated in regulation of membrane protease activity